MFKLCYLLQEEIFTKAKCANRSPFNFPHSEKFREKITQSKDQPAWAKPVETDKLLLQAEKKDGPKLNAWKESSFDEALQL